MRTFAEIVRVIDDAVNTIDWVSGAIDDGEYDTDDVVDKLSFANTDLMVVADDLRKLEVDAS